MPLCYFEAEGSDLSQLGLIVNDRVVDLERAGGPSSLAAACQLPAETLVRQLQAARAEWESGAPLASVALRAPIDAQEVWAAGVTYLRSRDARMEESTQRDVYDLVYDADRPELFLKATPNRVSGPGEPVFIRGDSGWDVPEPELTLAINASGEAIGYTVGNDVSSRSIEGENPLYLPQAKVYARSAAIGPTIVTIDEMPDVSDRGIRLEIMRGEALLFTDTTSTSRMHRSFADLVGYLFRCNEFPAGVFLMTGTGIVPPAEFTLEAGDQVRISIDGIGMLENSVARLPA